MMSTQRVDGSASKTAHPSTAQRNKIVHKTQPLKASPEHGWIIGDWIPAREVSSLGGVKGAGKTTFVTQLAISVAAGIPFGTLKPSRSFPVLFVSGDESKGALRHRFNTVLKRLGLAEKAKNLPLRFLDGSSKDSILCKFTPEGKMRLTPFYKELENDLAKHPGTFVILDDIENLWKGNNNSDEQVLAFIQECLGAIIQEHDCTIHVVYRN